MVETRNGYAFTRAAPRADVRVKTSLAAVALLGALAAVIVTAVAVPGSTSGGIGLEERWVSDTPRDNQRNHHAVGVGPAGEVVIAPVTAIPRPNVTLADDACELVRLAPADGAIVWRDGIPGEACFSHALTEPAIADLDGDGSLEAAVASTEDALVVHDAATGAEEWRVPLATYGYGRPTVANLTAAPGPEVVVSDIEGNVAAVDGDGRVLWRASLAATGRDRPAVWAAPIVADVDADGTPEVLVGGLSGPALFTADGDAVWSEDGGATYLTVAQADDDPHLEAFTAGGPLRAIDAATGEAEWERSLPGPRHHTVADVDADGVVELLVGTSDGRVLALAAATGETEWVTAVSGGDDVVAPPVAGDVDADGTAEVVAATRSGLVVVLEGSSGVEAAAFERAVPVWTVPTLADLDGDRAEEILVRYGDGRVVALDADTGPDVG
jgi:outer membrane protein assembly factor BamB